MVISFDLEGRLVVCSTPMPSSASNASLQALRVPLAEPKVALQGFVGRSAISDNSARNRADE